MVSITASGFHGKVGLEILRNQCPIAENFTLIGPLLAYANPQPPQPLFTEEDVKELTEMFPSVDAEVVKSVLEEKRGNKDAAANALVSMMAD